jgi:hypothetical protein
MFPCRRGFQGNISSINDGIAIDANAKLVLCWFAGTRDEGAAYHFIHDLKDRVWDLSEAFALNEMLHYRESLGFDFAPC